MHPTITFHGGPVDGLDIATIVGIENPTPSLDELGPNFIAETAPGRYHIYTALVSIDHSHVKYVHSHIANKLQDTEEDQP